MPFHSVPRIPIDEPALSALSCLALTVTPPLHRRYTAVTPPAHYRYTAGTMIFSLVVFYAVTSPLELARHELVESGWLFDRATVSPFYSIWTTHDFTKVEGRR